MMLVLLISAATARACPMCKDSTVDSSQPNARVDFNRSIYIMLGGFTSLVGMTGFVLFKATKSRL